MSDKIAKAKRDHARYQTPEYKEAQRARSRTPEYRAWQRTYQQTPERKEAARAYQQTPEAKAARRVQRQTPEAKAARRMPEYKARMLASYYKMPIEIPNHPMPDRCECCGEKSNWTLHLDHCHDTGRFRGWCCVRCNTCRGIADNAKLLRLRALYIERPFQAGPVNWAYSAARHIAHLARQTLKRRK
jgi:hypothetical protein